MWQGLRPEDALMPAIYSESVEDQQNACRFWTRAAHWSYYCGRDGSADPNGEADEEGIRWGLPIRGQNRGCPRNC